MVIRVMWLNLVFNVLIFDSELVFLGIEIILLGVIFNVLRNCFVFFEYLIFLLVRKFFFVIIIGIFNLLEKILV